MGVADTPKVPVSHLIPVHSSSRARASGRVPEQALPRPVNPYDVGFAECKQPQATPSWHYITPWRDSICSDLANGRKEETPSFLDGLPDRELAEYLIGGVADRVIVAEMPSSWVPDGGEHSVEPMRLALLVAPRPTG